MEYGKPEYFYINIKPGQELQMEGTIQAFSDSWGEETIGLYNENRENLFEVGSSLDKGQKEQFSFSWLSNADKDSYKYYIKRECTWHQVDTFSFDLSVTNRYDAGSQTDAGDSFGKEIDITLGEYTGYLSGKLGSDTKDFYKTSIKKEETLTIKVTPLSTARMTLVIYDSNRGKVKERMGSNLGAIITSSITSTKNENIFIVVYCDEYCSESVANYTLSIISEEASVDDAIILSNGETGGINGTIEEGQEIIKSIGETIVKVALQGITFLFFILVFGVAVYFFLKKRKKDLKKKEDLEKKEDLDKEEDLEQRE